MTWDEFTKGPIPKTSPKEILTNIKCPSCGKRLYLDDSVTLSTYPPQYYWCGNCRWIGSAYRRWTSS